MFILGSGVYRPRRWMTSDQIDAELKLSPGTAEAKSGVRRRPRAGDHSLAQMAAEAVMEALNAAQCPLESVDLLLFAGASFEQVLPCTAAFVQRELGARALGIAAFDVNSTCLSFLSAWETASAFLETRRCRTVVVVNAEIASQHLNPEELESYLLFGDGAAAFVLSSEKGQGPWVEVTPVAARMETHADELEACGIPGGGSRLNVFSYQANRRSDYQFHMDGPRLFKKAAELLPGFLKVMEKSSGKAITAMDWVVPHQASGSAMRLMRRRLGVDKDRWVDVLADHGNQISVSLPTAFHHLLSQKPALPADVLLVGTGAGVALGAVHVRLVAEAAHA